MQDTTKYPVGIQDFEKIRREGYVYVDKTAQIERLVSSGCYSERQKYLYFWCGVRSPGAHTRVRPYRYVGYVSHVPVGADLCVCPGREAVDHSLYHKKL